MARRQICRAHLRRDFTAHAEGLAVEKQFGELGLHVCERLFWAWEVFAHTQNRQELKRQIRVLRRELKPALRRFAGKSPRNKYCHGMARNLLKVWPALWTFASAPGVQPTNNHAERSLRGAVIYRKLSLDSQSEEGEQRIAQLLSASITCRLQHRSLHAYLIDLLNAHARGDPTPLLSKNSPGTERLHHPLPHRQLDGSSVAECVWLAIRRAELRSVALPSDPALDPVDVPGPAVTAAYGRAVKPVRSAPAGTDP